MNNAVYRYLRSSICFKHLTYSCTTCILLKTIPMKKKYIVRFLIYNRITAEIQLENFGLKIEL